MSETRPCPPLKPCPFCGGDAEIAMHHSGVMFRLTHRCRVVGQISLDWAGNAERLAAAWNTRHEEGQKE